MTDAKRTMAKCIFILPHFSLEKNPAHLILLSGRGLPIDQLVIRQLAD
jgi:hypothetical protein